MINAEISLLVAITQAGGVVRNPWDYAGHRRIVEQFLTEHYVLMGRETWFDFPFKENKQITPWVVSDNAEFQMQTRMLHSHAQCVDDLSCIPTVYPPKGIWWVLGGVSLFNYLLPFAYSIEATLVDDAPSAVNLFGQTKFCSIHRCPNPYQATLECVRYERDPDNFSRPRFSLLQMQT